MYKNFDEMIKVLSDAKPGVIVVAAAHDPHTLEGVHRAAKLLNSEYVLVGDKEQILRISEEIGFLPNTENVINTNSDEESAAKSIEIVRERGNVLVKGMLETSVLLKAALSKTSGIRETSTLSHAAVVEIPGYHKLITVTDGGMCVHPTLEQKVDIIKNVLKLYRMHSKTPPKIAALAASETVNDKMPESIDGSKLKKMCSNGEFGDAILEGPISFDLAMNKNAAAIKRFESPVTGDVDVLLVPSVTTGNVLCKSLIQFSNAKMAGVILGAKFPIVVVSRAASSEEKLLSIALAMTN